MVEKPTYEELEQRVKELESRTCSQTHSEEALKAALREKDILLKEVHHRVKNNMAVVSGLIGLQAANIKDEETLKIFKELRNRVSSMALVHELLYRSTSFATIDLGQYLPKLANTLLRTYCRSCQKVSLNLETSEVFVDIDQAVPCALVINELISNSLKYAFPAAGQHGKVWIKARSLDNGMIEIVVRDNGVGIPKEMDWRNTSTLGLSLVTNLVEKQLRGKVELNRVGGTEFTIIFTHKQAKICCPGGDNLKDRITIREQQSASQRPNNMEPTSPNTGSAR